MLLSAEIQQIMIGVADVEQDLVHHGLYPAIGQQVLQVILQKIRHSDNPHLASRLRILQRTPDGFVLCKVAFTYKKKAPVQHIIYGYLRVGEVLKESSKIKECYPWHPHAMGSFRTDDRLYLPADYGVFSYDRKLLLTKPGQPNRRLWSLPAFFAESGISISWQGENRPTLVNGRAELNSVCRGQEFVVTAETPELERELGRWVENLTGRAEK